VIERDQVQRDPEYFVSQHQSIAGYVSLQSSGSTGRPLAVFHDVFALFQGAVHRERLRTVVLRLARKRVRYRELRIVPPLSASPATRQAFQRSTLMSASVRTTALHLSLLDPPEENTRRLNEFRPDVVRGYGSYLEALFVWLRETEAPFHRPRAEVYGSDAMSEAVRRMITEDFGIRVLSAYGAIERSTWASSARRIAAFTSTRTSIPCAS
jgi:phenylacetate-coenzyme A ligase PaaK-like adenylate-forming protein